MTAATDEKDKALLMFVSLIDGRDARDPQEMWVVVTEEQVKEGTAVTEGRNAKQHLYTDLRKKLKYATPGAVFPVTLRETGISYTPKSMPLMRYADNMKVAEWSARSTAIERARTGARDFEKQILRKLDREGLEPYREAYRRLNSPSQVQLIAEVVRYITAYSR